MEESKLMTAIRLSGSQLVRQVADASPTEYWEWIGVIVGRIRAMKKARSDSAVCCTDEQKEEISKVIRDTVSGLSRIDVKDTKDGVRLKDLIAYYCLSELSDDSFMAKSLDNARRAYRANSADTAVAVRFGWLLHYCIKDACCRKNFKLVQFFKDEFEKWTCPENGDKNMPLKDARDKDLKAAGKLLSGPLDAKVFYAEKDWNRAIVACRRYLDSNPGDRSAYDVMLRAYKQLGGIDDRICFLKVCLEAIKWNPQSGSLRKKFIYESKQLAWDIGLDVRKGLAKNIPKGGCATILELLADNYDVLVNANYNSVCPASREWWAILDAATQAISGVFYSNPTVDELKPLARRYIGFSGNYAPYLSLILDDKNKSSGRVQKLGRRVAMIWARCYAIGVDLPEDGDQMRYLLAVEGRFDGDDTEYYKDLADVYFFKGDMDRSRYFAKGLVRNCTSEAWRWRVLARTYQKGSVEFEDCMTRANVVDTKKRKNNAYTISLFFGDEVHVLPPASLKESFERAGRLLDEGAAAVEGVVLTVFKDPVRQARVMRIWRRDGISGRGHCDFVDQSMFEGDEDPMPGDVVSVSVSKVSGRESVLGVSPCMTDRKWGAYPFRDAILIEKNMGRHYAKLMVAEGEIFSVNERKCPLVSDLQVGCSCRVAILPRPGMAPIVLAVQNLDKGDKDNVDFRFVRSYSGRLKRARNVRDGIVGDVVVPVAVKGDISFGREVAGRAVNVGSKSVMHWRAITCSEISTDLGGAPVVGGASRKCSRELGS